MVRKPNRYGHGAMHSIATSKLIQRVVAPQQPGPGTSEQRHRKTLFNKQALGLKGFEQDDGLKRAL